MSCKNNVESLPYTFSTHKLLYVWPLRDKAVFEKNNKKRKCYIMECCLS